MSPESHDVAVAVLVRGHQVLLCHRHPDRRWYPNVWDMPGGHIEPGESPADALRRELAEELGIHADPIDDEPTVIWTPEPDLRLHVWVLRQWSGEIMNNAPDEHDDIAWFDLDRIDDLALAADDLAQLIRNAVLDDTTSQRPS